MLSRLLRLVVYCALFFFLTITTQIGGVVFLLCIPLFYIINRKDLQYGLPLKFASFAILYVTCTLLVAPAVAPKFGRVAMPVLSEKVRPLSIWTVLLNRHYVVPELVTTVQDVATELDRKYPGTTVAYLDANFPFIEGFPLAPHLSHSDGKKIDIAFFYQNEMGEYEPVQAPSFIGYGHYEEPREGETNMPQLCERKGNTQYSILSSFIPAWSRNELTLEPDRTTDMVQSFYKHPGVSKIFLEPHLKERWGIKSSKVRFHGCSAVRHDDHLHVQMR